jgi:hypothetical protein
VKADLFKSLLKAGSDIALTIRERSALLPRRSEAFRELLRIDAADDGRTLIPRHLHPFDMVAEVVKVKTKAPALVRANDVAKLFPYVRCG